MMITEVRTTKRGRRSIYVDGEYVFALHPDAAAEFGLYSDTEVDEGRLEAALARSKEIEAGQKALRLLSSRSYTAKKLREKLSVHGGEAAEVAVERMEELGLVDDADYARRYAEQLYLNKFYAPRRIRQALAERGVPADIAREVADGYDPGDNPGRAADYLARRYPDLSDEKVKSRAYGALQRLGYNSGEIIRAFGLSGCREEAF